MVCILLTFCSQAARVNALLQHSLTSTFPFIVALCLSESEQNCPVTPQEKHSLNICTQFLEEVLTVNCSPDMNRGLLFIVMLPIYNENVRSGSRNGAGGITTRYGLEGPGIESRWGRDFPPLSRPAPRPTQPSVQWVPGHSRGKGGRGPDVDPQPPSSVPRSTERNTAVPLLSVRAFAVYKRV
jgi:hypothetical protein